MSLCLSRWHKFPRFTIFEYITGLLNYDWPIVVSMIIYTMYEGRLLLGL